MKFASVDIGSNTIRLLVAEIKNGVLVPVYYGNRITRLARGLRETGKLDVSAVAETIAVLKEFHSRVRENAVSETVVAGTEAIRSASNSGAFLEEVRRGTSFEVKVLPGGEEARLTALGVVSSFDKKDAALVLDIGGGSTEMMMVRDSRLVHWLTLPVGVVKLTEEHVFSDPPAIRELESLSEAADTAAETFSGEFRHLLGEHAIIIGTAGTPTTAAAIDLGLKQYDHERVHGHIMSLGTLESMLSRLSSMPMETRAAVDGLEPGRADLIIAGIILTIRIMKSLGFHEMTVSDHGLLEGLLLDKAGVRPLAS